MVSRREFLVVAWTMCVCWSLIDRPEHGVIIRTCNDIIAKYKSRLFATRLFAYRRVGRRPLRRLEQCSSHSSGLTHCMGCGASSLKQVAEGSSAAGGAATPPATPPASSAGGEASDPDSFNNLAAQTYCENLVIQMV